MDRTVGLTEDRLVDRTVGLTEDRSGGLTEGRSGGRLVDRTAVGWMGAEVVRTKPLVVALVVLQEPRVVLQQEGWTPAFPQRRGGRGV